MKRTQTIAAWAVVDRNNSIRKLCYSRNVAVFFKKYVVDVLGRIVVRVERWGPCRVERLTCKVAGRKR